MRKKQPKKRKFGVQCAKCGERLFSWWRHDFHHCKCGGTFVDGGWDYLRYGGEEKPRVIYFRPGKDPEPRWRSV